MYHRSSWLILFACAAFVSLSLGFITRALDDFRFDDFRPGIGEPEQAKTKIKNGMTKDEVRSILGRPHSPKDGEDYEDEWTYRCDFFGGTVFRVCFGSGDCVTYTEWWLN